MSALGGVGKAGSMVNKIPHVDRLQSEKVEAAAPAPLGGVDSEFTPPPPARPTAVAAGVPLGGVARTPGSNLNGGGGVPAAQTPVQALAEAQAAAAAAAAAAESAGSPESDESMAGEPTGGSEDDSGVSAPEPAGGPAQSKPEGLSRNKSTAWDMMAAGADDEAISKDRNVKEATVTAWRSDWGF